MLVSAVTKIKTFELSNVNELFEYLLKTFKDLSNDN